MVASKEAEAKVEAWKASAVACGHLDTDDGADASSTSWGWGARCMAPVITANITTAGGTALATIVSLTEVVDPDTNQTSMAVVAEVQAGTSEALVELEHARMQSRMIEMDAEVAVLEAELGELRM
jgi:hypothetical protein